MVPLEVAERNDREGAARIALDFVGLDGGLDAMNWTSEVSGMDLMTMGQRHQAYTRGVWLGVQHGAVSNAQQTHIEGRTN